MTSTVAPGTSIGSLVSMRTALGDTTRKAHGNNEIGEGGRRVCINLSVYMSLQICTMEL